MQEVLMDYLADNSLKKFEAEEVDTGTFTLDFSQICPAEENSDIEQHEPLRARHSKLELVLDSPESNGDCILAKEVAYPLELSQETLKVLLGLKVVGYSRETPRS